MYPNIYFALKDIFGIDLPGFKLVNSFGFFVALAFLICAWVLTLELRRKQQQGCQVLESWMLDKPEQSARTCAIF